jgi:transcriptional regulator with XRE-family HTH domain
MQAKVEGGKIRMAGTPSVDHRADSTLLSQALKAIRRRRGLRTSDVAERMGLPTRSYERFEAGRGALNVARVHAFAEATDSDGYAILMALDIRSAAFALRCIDNKAMTLMVMAIQEFDGVAQDDIGRLEPRSLIAGYTQMFDALTAKAREIDAFVEQWMSDKALHGPSDPDAPDDPPKDAPQD